ncbi:MAG: hypothetical protein R3C49_16100 [Planctomycetaceae bacterium]
MTHGVHFAVSNSPGPGMDGTQEDSSNCGETGHSSPQLVPTEGGDDSNRAVSAEIGESPAFTLEAMAVRVNVRIRQLSPTERQFQPNQNAPFDSLMLFYAAQLRGANFRREIDLVRSPAREEFEDEQEQLQRLPPVLKNCILFR